MAFNKFGDGVMPDGRTPVTTVNGIADGGVLTARILKAQQPKAFAVTLKIVVQRTAKNFYQRRRWLRDWLKNPPRVLALDLR